MNKKELVSFVVGAVVLTIVFGFDDGSETFQLSFWLINLLKSFATVLFCMFIYYAAQYFFARIRDASIEYKLWTINRFTFKDYHVGDRPSVPIGIIIALLTSFVTGGSFFFTGVGTTEIIYEKSRRTGRRFTNIGEYESSLIYLAGPLALSIILFICNWLSFFEIDLTRIMTVSIYLLIFSILPIPGLDGAKAFTNSRLAYVFFIAFVLLNVLLANVGINFAIFLSIIMALIILGIYYYKWEK
jgi:hypothetical protein